MKFRSSRTGNRVNWARRRSTGTAHTGTEVVDCVVSPCIHPPSWPPFAPPELPGFVATMGPLTSEPPVLLTGRFPEGNPAHERRSVCGSGLPASRRRIVRPFHLQPPVAVLEDRFWFRLRGLPRHRTESRASTFTCLRVSVGLRHWLAGSPRTTGRIEFVILRTGRSPPVALHPLSQGRSYSRIQGSEPNPGEDLHLANSTRSQAH